MTMEELRNALEGYQSENDKEHKKIVKQMNEGFDNVEDNVRLMFNNISSKYDEMKIVHEEGLREIRAAREDISRAVTLSSFFKWSIGLSVAIIMGLLAAFISISASTKASDIQMVQEQHQFIMRGSEILNRAEAVINSQESLYDTMTMFYTEEYDPQKKWTRKVYDSMIKPAYDMAIENRRRLEYIEKRLR